VGEKVTDLLQQGILAARAGKREQARALLMQLVEADERNEQAWLWLAGVVDAPEDIRTCLQNVLDLNPANQQAQQGLAWLEKRYGLAAPPEPQAPPPAPPEREVSIAPAPPPTPPEREVSIAPAPPPAPERQRSYTGPTTKFSNVDAAPAAGSQVPPVVPIAASPPEYPCPYCGAPTVLKQQACTQCHGDLMVRAASSGKRSLALTMLGVLWGIGGVLLLLSTLLVFFLFLWLRQSAQARAAAGSADPLLLVVAFTLVLGMFYIIMARGLLARRTWAYVTNIILIGLSFFSTLSTVAVGSVLFGSLLASLGRARNAEAAAGTAGMIGGAVLGIAFVLLPIALSFLSYRDFWGPKVRFQPVVEPGEHLVHYNNGIAYKNRGMWYMAAQEWEVAVSKKPHEPSYLHALGLAYAQLKQFEKARATLDRAIQAAPNNPQIKESRALIDQMATK
jgi:tetratricopeptide (TPR) repeat protein